MNPVKSPDGRLGNLPEKLMTWVSDILVAAVALSLIILGNYVMGVRYVGGSCGFQPYHIR